MSIVPMSAAKSRPDAASPRDLVPHSSGGMPLSYYSAAKKSFGREAALRTISYLGERDEADRSCKASNIEKKYAARPKAEREAGGGNAVQHGGARRLGGPTSSERKAWRLFHQQSATVKQPNAPAIIYLASWRQHADARRRERREAGAFAGAGDARRRALASRRLNNNVTKINQRVARNRRLAGGGGRALYRHGGMRK